MCVVLLPSEMAERQKDRILHLEPKKKKKKTILGARGKEVLKYHTVVY